MGLMEPNLATVRQRRAALAQMREQIEAEEKELEITERVLTRLAAGTGVAPPAPMVNGNLLTGMTHAIPAGHPAGFKSSPHCARFRRLRSSRRQT